MPEWEAIHALIDSLYVSYEVAPESDVLAVNKMRKASYLVQ